MGASLLATKLYIPPVRAQGVRRARLIERLEAGLRERRKLTLISAPPGFGKTTLISAWISGGEAACAWVSLDAGDNDPITFLSYLVAAFQRVDGGIGQGVAGLLGASPPVVQGVMTGLINDLAALNESMVLVLDDYHLITEPMIHEMVGFLLDNLPPALHLVIGTREDPPLPLPRLRARGQITEIRQRDLRFSVEETQDFMRATMRLELGEGSVAALHGRTEGWITGLQLAALAVQNAPDEAGFIADFAGDDRFIMDYLMGEVLAHVPERMRVFLHQTAILDQFTAGLCDAVRGENDSRSILDALEAANLFVIPLDNKREWYRYHHLFADVLQLGLDASQKAGLHGRAAGWHWESGLPEAAIHHALMGGRITGDYGQAEAWISAAAMPTFASGALITLHGWLDALPAGRIEADPELGLIKGWLLAGVGNLQGAERYAVIDAAGAANDLRGRALLLAGMVALMGHGDYQGAIGKVDQALGLLGDDQAYWRLIGLWIKGEAHERMGPMSAAVEAFRAASGLVSSNHVFQVTVEMSLAQALNLMGQRREAMRVCGEAIGRYTDGKGQIAPIAAMLLSLMGMLCYEGNEIERARVYHEQALAAAKQTAVDAYGAVAYGHRAGTWFALGDADGALGGLETAMVLAGETVHPQLGWLPAIEADLRVRLGDRGFGAAWVESAGFDQPDHVAVDAWVIGARVLVQMREWDRASVHTARLRAFLEQRGMVRHLISVTLFEALIDVARGERDQAVARVRSAVGMAAAEDYQRAFLDEDARIMELVREARGAAPQFVDAVLTAGSGAPPAPRVVSQGLIEPLSEREIEVLGLMAVGCSNAEIAERLYIAVGTVKRHINNMFGKMDVESRTQAIAKGRRLGLIGEDGG